MSVVIYHKSAVFTSAIYHSYTTVTTAAPAASVDQGAGVHDKAQREEIAREHPTHQHLLHST